MKNKRVSFFESKKLNENTIKKPLLDTQPFGRGLKGTAQNIEKTKESSKLNANENITISRTDSLNKKDNKKPGRVLRPTVKLHNKQFECTYFGQGFQLQKSAKDLHLENTIQNKIRLNSMRKTVTYWNSSSGNNKKIEFANSNKINVIPKENDANPHLSRKSSFISGHNGASICLPLIEQRGRPKKLWTEIVKSEIEDKYIQFITTSKEMRTQAVSLNRPKETEIQTKQNCNPCEDNQRKEDIRTFNWEGIHFEVSPKRDGSLEDEKSLRKEYSKELNLMCYNFNGSLEKSTPQAITSRGNKIKKRPKKFNGIKERCATNGTIQQARNEERINLTNIKSGKKEEHIILAENKELEQNIIKSAETDLKNLKPPRPPSPIANKCNFSGYLHH